MYSYDIIVIGAGHAGSEAAVAAARLGSKVLLITMDMTKIAQMSCNPAIGGIAKGQIVREIDALGGCTGLITDASTLQFRMLNCSKGPAVWSPRAQCDRMMFSQQWRSLLESTKRLDMWQDLVVKFLFRGEEVCGVVTQLGATFYASAIILTAGTFLNGKIHIGSHTTEGGRVGEPSAKGVTEDLMVRGVVSARMKTGTPPRIDGRSIDLTRLAPQEGDDPPARFSFLPIHSSIQEGQKQRLCYMVYTSNKVHSILRDGFADSPLFSGRITGVGPRYCPSIEDKLHTFADKEEHLLFLEPEGWNSCEFYLQGFSSSLPYNIQIQALKAIHGFENVRTFRSGYAIEYDYFPPTQISHALEVKTIPGLFFAGQVNGTTGYEEAAAQGLMAGINAFLKINGKPPFVLRRDQAYIGVMIDDLVTKGVDEPYRMFTSRAEYRILLRQDNADERLTPIAYSLGLASDERMKHFEEKSAAISELSQLLHTHSASPEVVNPYLSRIDSSLLQQKRKWVDLISRPNVALKALLEVVSRETEENDKLRQIINRLLTMDPLWVREVVESVEIALKYKGYIVRESELAQKMMRLDYLQIPQGFPFDKVSSLSIEARQKIMAIQPATIGQASRIPGVSPADISVLLIYFGR